MEADFSEFQEIFNLHYRSFRQTITQDSKRHQNRIPWNRSLGARSWDTKVVGAHDSHHFTTLCKFFTPVASVGGVTSRSMCGRAFCCRKIFTSVSDGQVHTTKQQGTTLQCKTTRKLSPAATSLEVVGVKVWYEDHQIPTRLHSYLNYSWSSTFTGHSGHKPVFVTLF